MAQITLISIYLPLILSLMPFPLIVLWNKNFPACIHFFFTRTFFAVSRMDFSCSRAHSGEMGYARLGNNS